MLDKEVASIQTVFFIVRLLSVTVTPQVTFQVDDLHFQPTIDPARKEEITRCLFPYFGPILLAGDCDSVALVGEGLIPQTFPFSVFTLPHLTSLHLDNNYLGRKAYPVPSLTASSAVSLGSRISGYIQQQADFFETLASLLTTLHTLTLSNNDIGTFPLPLCALSNLTFLSLNKNNISVIPPEIANLNKLHTLSLSQNVIKGVPPELAKLVNLRVLNLQYNQLKSLNAALQTLDKLERLEVHHNAFESPFDVLETMADTQVLFHTAYTPKRD